MDCTYIYYHLMVFRFLFILVFLSFSTVNLHAQYADVEWKKTVARTIDWKPVHNEATHHLKDIRKDSVIFEMIVKAVLIDKIPVFNDTDSSLSTYVKQAALTEMFRDRIDTFTIIDPINGQELTKAVSLPFQYSSIHKFRIVEDWVFHPITLKTEIMVTAIAPLMEVYSSQDEVIGVKPMFWLKYGDVKNVINRYEQYHPDNSLAALIWKDYFSSDIKPTEIK